MNTEKFKKYLSSSEGCVAQDAIDPFEDPRVLSSLEEHDARFHPHGYKDGDTCKYREALARGDLADYFLDDIRSDAEWEEDKDKNGATPYSPTPQDYKELWEMRDSLERIARLLNGRVGNLPALQSSSRWPLLAGYETSRFPADSAKLSRWKASSDAKMAAVATTLEQIAQNIVKSGQNGWTYTAGQVPSDKDLPPIPSSPSSTSPTQSYSSSTNFTDDDAKATLLRAAKSVNHHIDRGDFTPNAKAIAALHAAEQDIRSLGDKTLEGLMDDIFASEKGGFKTRIGNVPPPSAAWQQSNTPKMPSIFASLFGLGGNSAPSAPKAPGTTKKNPWTPFQAPSKYQAALDAVNANHPAATDPNYWKNKADSMTLQQAVQDMEAKGSIVKGGYYDTMNPNDPDEVELWSEWTPSQKLSKDTATCAAVCFDDLRTRFPNMPWKANLELRCGICPGSGGQSTHTSDWRRHTVLFNCDYGNIWPGVGLGKANYGHSDARFPFDVLRHEMGHALISGMLPDGRRMITKWHDAMTAAYGNPAKDLESFASRYVSAYAVTRKRGGFSMAECLSECFSLATSPDYKPGYLPPPVEDFIFGEMLGVKA